MQIRATSASPGTGLIRARDLEGATTARVGDRVALVLSHRRRRRAPIILDLAGRSRVGPVRKSLGIGHHGFGHVDFEAYPSRLAGASRVLCAMAILAALAMLIPNVAVIATGLIALFVLLSAIAVVAFTSVAMPPAFVRITSGGVFFPTGLFVPFQVIEDVQLLAGHFAFQVRTDRGVTELKLPVRAVRFERRGATRDELEHMAAQIRAAADRAHGKFALKSEPEALASQLARGKDESDSSWHARLDTIAIGQAGYRALSAEPTELWALLEDPEAHSDVRAGAARVLRRVDKDALRVRVAEVLATVRDKETRTRIADSIEEEEEPQPDSQSAAHSWSDRTRTPPSPRAASSASHAASAAAIVVKYGMFASSVCRRSE